mgnify:CR=1 FL=1
MHNQGVKFTSQFATICVILDAKNELADISYPLLIERISFVIKRFAVDKQQFQLLRTFAMDHQHCSTAVLRIDLYSWNNVTTCGYTYIICVKLRLQVRLSSCRVDARYSIQLNKQFMVILHFEAGRNDREKSCTSGVYFPRLTVK